MSPIAVIMAVVIVVCTFVGVVASVLLDAQEIHPYGPTAGSRKGVRRAAREQLPVLAAAGIIVLLIVAAAVAEAYVV